MKTKLENKINYLLENFKKHEIKDTINILCAKGIANGAYNNYMCLVALIDIITEIEAMKEE